MATESEIITHEKTRRAFKVALKKLLTSPITAKTLGLPGFDSNCRLDNIVFTPKNVHDWDKDSTTAQIDLALGGNISGQPIDADGTAKLQGLMAGWSSDNVPVDYAVARHEFVNMKISSKVI